MSWIPIVAAALIVVAIVLWVYFSSQIAHELDQIIEEIDRHKR